MSRPGTSDQPLRVAVVGAGPAGFYAAEHLLKQEDLTVEVDLFDRLPTPFGLVRAGVAPDHQKIKSVTRVYEKTAAKPGFRFFGNVTFGSDINLDDLRSHYHAVIFTTGAQTDRALGIPGEDLPRSHSATEFVAWYNGHPDYRELEFDLSQKSVAVVGVGNVAIDVARILCKTAEELAGTDIADYALDALRQSRVEDVYVLGRRGPVQAAFTDPEIKEMGELSGTDVIVLPEEARLDPLSERALSESEDRALARKVDLIQGLAGATPHGRPRRLHLRFLVSPVELTPAADGGVGGMRIVHNDLYADGRGNLRPRATERTEHLEVGLVFRSVGYRGTVLPGVPFRDDWAVICNDHGRVVDDSGSPVTGLYTAGWIKRGPSGIIGTNKACSVETVNLLLEDLASDRLLAPEHPSAETADSLVRSRQPVVFDFEDWRRLDELEKERGAALGRPRVKFTTVREMAEALGR
ncbi:MAG: FAD-dependent oxidoreductase [Gemmatimonadetes bacterium]|nr:FAD-dependent oxidoreductase [Gemmatimonadota bacterium]